MRGVRDGRILAWCGIPYAAPPVGSLRFRAPRPVLPWTGIRDASQFGNVSPQPYRGQFRGAAPNVPAGEDCLTVNVLAATVTRRKRLGMPVMVFIHGGGYSAGSSQDFPGQGETFVRSGQVVYVSFNYRLGALGYLNFSRYSTSERPIESNLGLRDQVAALDWVRANIRGFGGDPNNVTLFGESAGGNAVTTLLTTPSARGLFARAIAQSPPPNAVYTKEHSDGWAAEFIALLRTDTAKPGDDLANPVPANELLESAPVASLNRAALIMQVRTPDSQPGTFCLAPVVDGDFLPERPLDAFTGGRSHPIPLIIGTNAREGSVFRGRFDILPKSPNRIRSLFEHAPPTSTEAMGLAYPGLPEARIAADFAGDFAFWFPSLSVACGHSQVASVHAYRFDLAPRLLHLLGFDATHGIELFALFDNVRTPFARTMTALGGRAQFSKAGERMRRHWLRFALTGGLDASWPDYSPSSRQTLIIDEFDRVESDPHRERRLAWEAFLPLG